MLSLLLITLLASLRVCLAADSGSNANTNLPLPPPLIYSSVDLAQLCADSSNYCIYVDQVRPGTVRASPYIATDNQGAFLFERRAFLDRPIHVCYGGCCINLDFSQEGKDGCVRMSYVNRPSEGVKGHLLGRFADNQVKLLGPGDRMEKTMLACGKGGRALPYAVIQARSGHRGRKKVGEERIGTTGISKIQKSDKGGEGQDSVVTEENGAKEPSKSDGKAQPKRGHDYFDDVTVPLVDAW